VHLSFPDFAGLWIVYFHATMQRLYQLDLPFPNRVLSQDGVGIAFFYSKLVLTMFSTILFVAIFLGLLFLAVAQWAFFLRFGLLWVKVSDVTFSRVFRTALVVFGLQLALNVFFRSLTPLNESIATALNLCEIAATILIPCSVIRGVFNTPFKRAFLAWLPTLLATITTYGFVILVLRPFLYEAFSMPANSMAPTIIGTHLQSTCKECGKPNYCSPRNSYRSVDKLMMICDKFHVSEVMDVDKTVHTSDRILVAKFLTPRRWDLVVFQFPEEPSINYVKRLVGFPGEKIHIADGSVWADGVRLTPPAEMDGIEYLSELPMIGPIPSGSAEAPALLGNDEYFVLGDFSAQSMDSRLWKTGAKGHNRYAVPKQNILGVVTHTFLPLHRWRVFR
jgi:signal peptidase I